METGAGLQVLLDLFTTAIKFMGRTAVQRQLITVALVLLASWYLAEPLITRMGRLYARWLAAQRARVAVTGGQSVTTASHVRAALRVLRPLIQVADTIVLPLLAILLMGLSIPLFQRMGWVSGLLVDTLGLLALFLAYRLLLGILYASFDRQRVRYYEARLLRPLLVVIVILLVVDGIMALSTLAAAPLFALFGGLLTLGTLFLATFGLYFWIVAVRLTTDVVQTVITTRTKADPSAVEASLILLRYLLVAVAIVFTLQLIGLNATALAAVLGGLSFGAGLALQDVLRNFLGGIILLFEGSIRPGDWVKVEGTLGRVESLRIRSTVVRTEGNIEFTVPNQHYLSSTIVTYNATRPGLLLKLPVSVNGDVTAIQEVQQKLIEVASQHPGVQPRPEPAAPLLGAAENRLDFELQAWTADAQQKGNIEAALRVLIVEALDPRGIGVSVR